MRIYIRVMPQDRDIQMNVPDGSTVQDIIQSMDMKPDSTVSLIGNDPIPIDSRLDDEDRIILIKVSSSG